MTLDVSLDRWHKMVGKIAGICVAAVLLAGPMTPAHAAIAISELVPSLPPPQPVGTPVVWTATASDPLPGTLEFQFSARRVTAAAFSMVRDFHSGNAFLWASIDREGLYVIQVVVRNTTTGERAQAQELFQLTSRVTGGVPVVSPTVHPLVALYSAPPCPQGSSMTVRFRSIESPPWTVTPPRPCDGTSSMNFYLAGMPAVTTHIVRHELAPGSPGPVLSFTTRRVPLDVGVPPVVTPIPPNPLTSLGNKILLNDYLSGHTPIAMDLTGNVLWYYPELNRALGAFIVPVPGGTMLLVRNDPTMADPFQQWNQILFEADLAGHPLRETNAARVSEQLLAMGWREGITSFHHDAIRLPNGHTLALAATERLFPAGTQGAEGPVDILGDVVLDLDENFQVVWAWNAFDHMDVNRAAVLGETCAVLQIGCPPFFLAPVANDWLHSNSLFFEPSTGDVLISMRHMDWVARIDYDNGTGTGAVVWRLGPEGDFTIDSPDPYPWFSHQHYAAFEPVGSRQLLLFDNGNARVEQFGGNSRGQVYEVDETNMTVSLRLNVDLGAYAYAFGSAERLDNGNYSFGAGTDNGQAIEVLPAGPIVYRLRTIVSIYRSYRLTDMYTPVR